jgi:hypothetical protein
MRSSPPALRSRVRRFFQLGFRVERDAETRALQHEQVVGAVADGDGLLDVDAFALGDGVEEVRLALGAHDGLHDAARELAVLDLERFE